MLILPIFNFIFYRCTAFVLQCMASYAVSPALMNRLPATRKERSHSIHIVRQISQANFGPGSYNTYGSQNQVPGLLRLDAKDMLNPRTYPGPGSIAALLAFRQFAMAATFALNVFTKAVLFQAVQTVLGPIRRIRPDVLAGIVGKDRFKHVAVMHSRISNGIASDKFVLDINRYVIFVTEKCLAILLGPAGVNILTSAFILWPIFGDFALFYPVIFFAAVTLLGYVDNTGINNLALHGQKSMFAKVEVKSIEQLFNNSFHNQVFPESPDCCGIRNLATNVQSKKTPEGVPVKYLELCRIIGKVVQRLKNQDFEKQNSVVAFGSYIGLPLLATNLFEFWAKNLPVNSFIYLGKRISLLVDFIESVFEIKKSGLNHADFSCAYVMGD
jgi:hypothetical protein